MAKISLRALDDGQRSLDIPIGKTTIGRGAFLGCNDKKVSRNHAVLEVNDLGEVYLTPTHVNPCFYQPTADSAGTILKKDKAHKLENGDIFSLLPRAFRYKLVVEYVSSALSSSSPEKVNDVVDPKPEEKVNGLVNEKRDTNIVPDAKKPEVQPVAEKVNGETVCQQEGNKSTNLTPSESSMAEPSSKRPEESNVEEEKTIIDEKQNLELNGGESQETAKPVEEKQPEETRDTSTKEEEEEEDDDDDNDEREDFEDKNQQKEVSQESKEEKKEEEEFEDDDDEEEDDRGKRTLPDWMQEKTQTPLKEEKKRTKTPKQHHREKASAKRKTDANAPEKKTKRKRTERRKESDNDERFEHPQRQSARTTRQTRQGISLEDFVASDDDEWQSDFSEPRQSKRRRRKRKDDDSGSDWEVEHKKTKRVIHKVSSGSESGSDWGSQRKKKTPTKRGRRRNKRANECDTISEEEEDKPQTGDPGKRSACQFGKKCFRKNPNHMEEFSHPGDSDYEAPEEEAADDMSEDEDSNDLPECPFGTNCYRKNPQHKKEYKHTKKVRPQREAAKQAGKKSTASDDNEEERDAYDINDSLLDEDSDEYKPANSGSDVDGSQEMSSPLKGTKRLVKNKRGGKRV